VAASDVFASRDEAFAIARANNPLPPDANLRHRSDASLMRTEDGRWTYRYDRVLRNPANLRRRDAATGWASCANIAVPTQIIRGDLSDILSPEIAQRMVETIPDARLDVVARSGHAVPLDAPEGFLAAAREFLRG
jgi:pimeloyl-ACP methyl ester carboxylesterase